MCKNHCGCFFLPPFILDNLAKAGIEGAQLTVHQSKDIRVKRKEKRVDVHDIMAGISNAENDLLSNSGVTRSVYDCKNQFSQRVQLVRDEGGPATSDEVTNHAYEYAGIVFDYFKNQLSRNSIDNRGLELILNVHYGVNYNNAFWDGDEMTFGDGDGSIFTSFANSKDVVGHELSHGVTQYTANLAYDGQSGALNEHFSDVFGTAIKQFSNEQTAHDADWLIGNDIMGPTLFGESLRSMKAPGTAYDNSLMGRDPQPAHMKDYYTGSNDNHGVHTNSGILNRAFYLVAMEIGTDKAARIWYHTLQNLWSTANFNAAVQKFVSSAQILTKNEEVPFGTTQTVRAAFREVGLPS